MVLRFSGLSGSCSSLWLESSSLEIDLATKIVWMQIWFLVIECAGGWAASSPFARDPTKELCWGHHWGKQGVAASTVACVSTCYWKSKSAAFCLQVTGTCHWQRSDMLLSSPQSNHKQSKLGAHELAGVEWSLLFFICWLLTWCNRHYKRIS